ncbi:MAG TPA: L-rhamnose/proton symporter RhaT [Agriterribacter sp.]|nr:L-rhamnose/proton symporter RhaT [Agriterribacter sp.]
MEYFLGILFHSIGGFSSASFYVPTYKIKKWQWQTYWITLGFVAWMIMPTIGGWITTSGLFDILSDVSFGTKFLTYFYGVLWGFGGLMAGLGIRYLGLALGQSICLGVCVILGTIIPAAMDHKLGLLFNTTAGLVILLGFVICLVGIIFCGYAGVLKEKNATTVERNVSVKEFSAAKGLLLAIAGGVMSSFMALAINAGSPIAAQALESGTANVFVNIPIFVLALAGGFTTNFIYALILTVKKKTVSDFRLKDPVLMTKNFLLSALAGIMWYCQYFFYGMGATKMGQYDFASWTLHLATIIIFSNLWGIYLKEWEHINRKTKRCLWSGITLLIISVVLIGIGNKIGGTV